MSRDREPSAEDWDRHVPWPFHALLAWSLVLLASLVTLLVATLLGKHRLHDLWSAYVGGSNWVPAVFAPIAWWDAWKGQRASALRLARMFLLCAMAGGVAEALVTALWQGWARALLWPLLVATVPSALLLAAFASRSVSAWVRAERGVR